MEVTIRPLKVEDAYISVKWRNDSDVFKYTGNTYGHEITIESELKWINKVIAKNNDYRCAILVDGMYVGSVYLTDIDGEKATYHIFIGDKNYWGKGVAKIASEQIIDYAFTDLHLRRVELKVNEKNIRAIKLYKSLDFKENSRVDGWINMVNIRET